MDDWDWDLLEASPLKGTTTATQRLTALPPLTVNHEVEEGNRQDDHSDHEVDTLNWDVLEHTPDTDTKTKLDNTSQLLSSLTCERKQEQWLLCQDTCGYKKSLPNLDEKTRIIQDYGLHSGIADLISNTHIAVGQAVSCNSNWWWCVIGIFEAVERNRYFHWQFCVISDPCV